MTHGGPYEAIRLESVDPGGVIADNLPLDRMIASVVYAAAAIERSVASRAIVSCSPRSMDRKAKEFSVFRKISGRRDSRRRSSATFVDSVLQSTMRSN
jgi:hypothetical protein